jgi:DNA-binding NarL/FixJ family response regulator
MCRVLVIDDDVGTLIGYKGVLRCAGHTVTTAALGEDGVLAARRDPFDVVLCDQRLLDIPGTSVIRQIREACRETAIVLVTGWGTPELLAEAMSAGATTCAAKPLIGDELVTVVDHALQVQATGSAPDAAPIGYASSRWVELVVRGVHLPADPRTIPGWCHGTGHAHATLKKRCEAVRVRAKDSLDLVRLLRVVILHAGDAWDLQRWLDIVDDRTAHTLVERAGLCADCSRVPDLDTFLSHQRLIRSPELIAAVRARLRHTRLD